MYRGEKKNALQQKIQERIAFCKTHPCMGTSHSRAIPSQLQVELHFSSCYYQRLFIHDPGHQDQQDDPFVKLTRADQQDDPFVKLTRAWGHHTHEPYPRICKSSYKFLRVTIRDCSSMILDIKMIGLTGDGPFVRLICAWGHHTHEPYPHISKSSYKFLRVTITDCSSMIPDIKISRLTLL